jgi:hypothetical protein
MADSKNSPTWTALEFPTNNVNYTKSNHTTFEFSINFLVERSFQVLRLRTSSTNKIRYQRSIRWFAFKRRSRGVN